MRDFQKNSNEKNTENIQYKQAETNYYYILLNTEIFLFLYLENQL